MPFETKWVPASRDESLSVYDTEVPQVCYWCKYCEGWIEGRPNRYHEDSLAPLAGRKGTVEHCRRCGREISFFGMMS